MTSVPRKICIVGGGITGLAAAWELKMMQERCGQPISIRLYEAAPHVGGKIKTTHQDGFVLEHGPDSFITQKPEAITLCKELGLEKDLIPCNTAQQRVYIARKEQLTALPSGFRLVAPTDILSFLTSDLFSLSGKIRALCEPFIPPKLGNEDESIADFVTRRLGSEVLDRVAGPMLGGLYNGDPTKLSMQSTFPLLLQLEKQHGSLIRGFRKIRQTAEAGPMFMSLRNGLGSLTETLEKELEGICLRECPVLSLQRERGKWAVETHRGTEVADAVILTVPPPAASSLIRRLSPTTSDNLDTLTANSQVAVSMGFEDRQLKRPSSLSGFGFLTAMEPNRILTACTWSSTKFEGRSPPQHHLVRAFLSGPDADTHHLDTYWLETARKTLHPYMAWSGEPVTFMVTRWPSSSPQYLIDHLKIVADLKHSLKNLPGVFLAGSSLEGVGLPDCIRQGRQAARASLQAE